MNPVLSTVMKPELPFGREPLRTSHSVKPHPYDDGYLGEVAAAGYALISNRQVVKCQASESLWPHDVLMEMFMTIFVNTMRSATLHDDHLLKLCVRRQVSALDEWHLLSLFNHAGHTQLTLEIPIERELPDYSYALNRLKIFTAEQEDWDGCGGLPASPEVARQVETFLSTAQCRGIKVPGLAMGGDGSVAVVWNTQTHYISADFDGTHEYSFFITEGEDYLKGGVSPYDQLDSDLATFLIKYFTDDSNIDL